MKRIIPIAAAILVVSLAGAAEYVNDFEGETIGSLPDGWYLATPWGEWAPGPITADVQPGPTGGQALKIVWGTDWASYGASSGETGYDIDMTGIDGADAIMTFSYDFWKENWRVWQVFGDQSWFPPAGIHMNDDPGKPNEMAIGTDDYGAPDHLFDVPAGAWVHVEGTYNSATGDWQADVSYQSGTGGGLFGGTYDTPNPIAGEFWFGGWAFQSTMDAEPVPPGGTYDNALYIDNFAFSVIPEPAALALLALGGLLLRRR